MGLGKSYAAEANFVASLVPGARTLLDVACGTGKHLEHLQAGFECAGLELDEAMLAIARTRCPTLPLVQGDMVDFDLGRQFDAVVCLFSSIGYMQTEERLRRAVASMAAHVAPGGTLLVEPWLRPDTFTDGHLSTLAAESADLKVVRMARATREGGCSHFVFHYLVGSAAGVEHLVETHVMGLFTWDQYRGAFEAAGLATEIDETGGPMGRGLVTGVLPG